MPTPADRIAAILGPDFELTPDVSFTYKWDGGSEVLEVSYASRRGGTEYRGEYHPHGICEGYFTCRYCGKALR